MLNIFKKNYFKINIIIFFIAKKIDKRISMYVLEALTK